MVPSVEDQADNSKMGGMEILFCIVTGTDEPVFPANFTQQSSQFLIILSVINFNYMDGTFSFMNQIAQIFLLWLMVIIPCNLRTVDNFTSSHTGIGFQIFQGMDCYSIDKFCGGVTTSKSVIPSLKQVTKNKPRGFFWFFLGSLVQVDVAFIKKISNCYENRPGV